MMVQVRLCECSSCDRNKSCRKTALIIEHHKHSNRSSAVDLCFKRRLVIDVWPCQKPMCHHCIVMQVHLGLWCPPPPCLQMRWLKGSAGSCSNPCHLLRWTPLCMTLTGSSSSTMLLLRCVWQATGQHTRQRVCFCVLFKCVVEGGREGGREQTCMGSRSPSLLVIACTLRSSK